MSEISTQLSLPFIQPAQAQKHVTHNEALVLLDMLVQLAVLDRTRTAPPEGAEDGARHIVAMGATEDWAGQDGAVAVLEGATWRFLVPRPGWRAWVLDEGAEAAFDGTGWTVSGAGTLEDLPGLGIGATSDPVNRLSVASDAALFSHAGADHRLALNKAGAGDTASLIFKTGFSGRAEIGLPGSDDFALKVSADGAAWSEALRVRASDGRVTVPGGGLREMLGGPRDYHVDAGAGDDAGDGLSPATAFATIGRALAALEGIDAGGHAVTIRLADGTYTLTEPLSPMLSVPGLRRIEIEGNLSAPGQVRLTGPSGIFDIRETWLKLAGVGLDTSGANATLIAANDGARVWIDRVEFGQAGFAHVRAVNAQVIIDGDYTITGGADFHIHLTEGASARGDDRTVALANGPGFTAFALASEVSFLRMSRFTFAGSATGHRYNVSVNAVIETNGSGENYFPGNDNGLRGSGGRYR